MDPQVPSCHLAATSPLAISSGCISPVLRHSATGGCPEGFRRSRMKSGRIGSALPPRGKITDFCHEGCVLPMDIGDFILTRHVVTGLPCTHVVTQMSVVGCLNLKTKPRKEGKGNKRSSRCRPAAKRTNDEARGRRPTLYPRCLIMLFETSKQQPYFTRLKIPLRPKHPQNKSC